jgi:hypothetical protein
MEKEMAEWENRKRMGAGARILLGLAIAILLIAGLIALIKWLEPNGAAAAVIDEGAAWALRTAGRVRDLFTGGQ